MSMTAVRGFVVLAMAALVGALWLDGSAAETTSGDGSALRSPGLRGCRLLPHRDAFHQRVDRRPETGNSNAIVSQILADGADYLHPGFGLSQYGIPYEVVGPRHRRVPVKITRYPEQSDHGWQPIPRNAGIEGGQDSRGDRHVLVLQRDGADADRACRLIELYRGFPPRRAGSKQWHAASVAVFDMGKPLPQRPHGWTSADAAGLPILPGLIRYREVANGRINHVIRASFARTRRAYKSPARHFASDHCQPTLPPMGMRLRLDDDYPIGWMEKDARVIARALKVYGIIVADNGPNFGISGERDRRWSNQTLNQLQSIPGASFEVVNSGAGLRTGC